MENENIELRQKLGLVLEADPQLATWELAIAQQTRDSLAVSALLKHTGDVYAALRHLGFEVPTGLIERRALALKVFDTPGVRELLAADLSDLEAERNALISRQVQIGKHGDPTNATAAFMALARVAGWNKADPPPAGGGGGGATNVNVLLNMGGGDSKSLPQREHLKELPHESITILDHEPGAAIKVDVSEDLGG